MRAARRFGAAPSVVWGSVIPALMRDDGFLLCSGLSTTEDGVVPRFRGSSALLAVLFLGVPPFIVSADDDAVTGMCLASKKSADVCACAAQKLRQEVGAEDYALYEAVGADYLDAKGRGVGMSEAWDSAVKAAAAARGAAFVTTLNKTNKLGKSHRKAMKACAS